MAKSTHKLPHSTPLRMITNRLIKTNDRNITGASGFGSKPTSPGVKTPGYRKRVC